LRPVSFSKIIEPVLIGVSWVLKNQRTGSQNLPYKPAVLCQFFKISQKSQTTGSFDFENISKKPKSQEVL
jgi:hypothetical protein